MKVSSAILTFMNTSFGSATLTYGYDLAKSGWLVGTIIILCFIAL